jgi:putative ABC transport system permease protein
VGLRARMSDDRTEVGRVFGCCGSLGFFLDRTVLRSGIDTVITGVDQRVAGLESPGLLLQVAGVLVALLVVGFAGVFAQAAREVELGLLFARGATPLSVGAKGALETFLPALIGGVAGLAAALALVVVLGPDGAVAGDATADAARAAGLAVLVAVLLLALVSAIAFLRRSERHRDRLRAIGRLPWEIAIIALAFLVLRRLKTGGAFVEGVAGGPPRPSPLLLLFPILFLAGFAVAGARLLPAVARWARPRSARRSPWAYLAVHRLAAAPRLAVLLVAASTLSLGIFVQAQTVVRSLEATVDAKARVFVGSDVQGRVGFDTPLPATFPMPTTRVTRRLLAGTLQPTGGTFDLLTIDTASFSGAAYWNDAFASEGLDEMLARLADHPGPAVPVVVAGRDVDPAAVFVDREEVAVDVVAYADAFPGMSSLRPLVVADEETFLAAFGGPNPLSHSPASTQLWVRGDEQAARASLQSLEFPPEFVLTASEVEGIPSIAAVIDTFLVLNALGLAAAALVVAAMLMYLQSRQRSQLVSYGLSLRMGMTHRAHRRSLVGELSAMLCSSYAMAVVLALTAALLTSRMLDPLESIPPGPLFSSPIATVAIALAAVAVVGWLGGWFANRRARRIDFGEVMRVAE